jgi:hypothetical protein
MNIKSIRLERVETAKTASMYHEEITEKIKNIDVRPRNIANDWNEFIDPCRVDAIRRYQQTKSYQQYAMGRRIVTENGLDVPQ